MLRNLIVLPDGTELYSGNGQHNNVRNATITKCVNSETELTLGSVCSSMLECKLQTPGGGLNIAEGTEITLYKVDDSGTRHKVGLFTMEKPTRPSAHMYKITAYDRVSWLDKDLTDWLAALEGWPYTVNAFAAMVCEACGLTLVTTDLLNGDYEIQQFAASGIRGRQLMTWIGEICARFCRANADGEIEFAWYRENDTRIGPRSKSGIVATGDVGGNVIIRLSDADIADDGDGSVTIETDAIEVISDDEGNLTITDISGNVLPYFQGGLTYEDYQTAAIEKVQIRLTEDDVGVVYPQVAGEANTYIITGNYLLTTSDYARLEPVVQNIYEAIKDVQYTPCTVRLQATIQIDAGDIMRITDANGAVITVYVMTKTQKGQADTLECTGSSRRDSSSVVNSVTLGALNKKILEVRKNIEGLTVTAQAFQTTVENNQKVTEKKAAELEITAAGIQSTVSAQTENLEGIKAQMTEIEQAADSVEIRVKSIEDDGVSKVTTTTGYTMGADGLNIHKEGEEIYNTLDHTGMYVKRGAEVMLQANADGVVATDVTVRNYLIVGTHARFEDYSNSRTACFWI